MWAFGFLLGFVFSMVFGWASAPGTRLDPAYRLDGGPATAAGLWVPAVVITIIFGLHLVERYVRHVQKREPFPEFLNGEVAR